jgi:hypothetical protein
MTRAGFSRTKRRLSPIGIITLVSASFALLCVTIFWLILGDASPLKEYFLYHVTLPNFIRGLHIPTYLLLVIFRPEPPFEEVIAYGSAFVQWFLVGFLLGITVYGALKLFARGKNRPRETSIRN